MDYAEVFERDVAAFAVAAGTAASYAVAPAVPSCPGWVVTDLVLHLGRVHRSVARVIRTRSQQPPRWADPAWLGLDEEWAQWLPTGSAGRAPAESAVPAGLLDWFQAGAAELLSCFRDIDPQEQVWTWSAEQSVGFWRRMQAIEAAIHRWDAETAVGAAAPLDADLAADAVGQNFEIMAPMRRSVAQAPPGEGERFLLRRTDGPGTWQVRFDGNDVVAGPADGSVPDIQISGTASDLALFVWQRPTAANLDVRGDTSLLSRYFILVPPL